MPADHKARRSLARWIVPAVAFVAGAVVGIALLRPSPDPAPARVSVPTFGTDAAPGAASGADPLPGASSTDAAELALQRQINDRFVAQLRQYEDRLTAIADGAEAEGAQDAATALRDFALETELLIDRYDLILKKN